MSREQMKQRGWRYDLDEKRAAAAARRAAAQRWRAGDRALLNGHGHAVTVIATEQDGERVRVRFDNDSHLIVAATQLSTPGDAT